MRRCGLALFLRAARIVPGGKTRRTRGPHARSSHHARGTGAATRDRVPRDVQPRRGPDDPGDPARGGRMRQAFLPHSLRPGGTVSGTTMMLLADVSVYVAVLASIGWTPLAVTTN